MLPPKFKMRTPDGHSGTVMPMVRNRIANGRMVHRKTTPKHCKGRGSKSKQGNLPIWEFKVQSRFKRRLDMCGEDQLNQGAE